jgi:hypothetical protein
MLGVVGVDGGGPVAAGDSTEANRVGRSSPASYARGSGSVDGEDVVVMAWRGLRARVAGASHWLRRLGVMVMAWRGLRARIAGAWRWLTGSGWDSKDVAELYGEQTNRGYGAGLGDVVNRQESNPARPQRAEHHKRPDADT